MQHVCIELATALRKTRHPVRYFVSMATNSFSNGATSIGVGEAMKAVHEQLDGGDDESGGGVGVVDANLRVSVQQRLGEHDDGGLGFVEHAQKLRRPGRFFEQDPVQCRRVSMVIDRGTNEQPQMSSRESGRPAARCRWVMAIPAWTCAVISSTRIASLFGKYW